MNPAIVIATCLMLEAGNQGDKGIELVADVIANRMKERKLTAVEVVRQPYQFESIDKKTTREVADDAFSCCVGSPKIWKKCLRLAFNLQAGAYKPATKHNHFFNPKLCNPSWASQLKDRQQHKDHVFGRIEI